MRASTEAAHLIGVARAIGLMRADPASTLRVEHLAEEARMARSHFLHVFRSVTSISPCRFLAAVRMEKAKALLVDSQESVTSICFEVGYQSVGTFTTLFTEFVGVSPTALRKLNGALAQMSVADFCFRNIGADSVDERCRHMVGSIEGLPDFEGAAFVGVFSSAIAQGRPLAGRFLPTLGRFRLQVPRTSGRACILAAALPVTTTVAEFLGPSQGSLLVAGMPLASVATSQCCGAVNLRLRKLTPFDPPVLTALLPLVH